MAWTFPVIGQTEWSGGSWMPYTQTHRGRTHAAIDIYATKGQTIVSPISGTVKNFGSGNVGGNWIQIQGNDGNVYYFAHMDQPVTLQKGQTVGGGQKIGLVGNTGSASTTSPHVHFSVKRDGKVINPTDMLRSGIVIPDIEFRMTGVEGGAGEPPGAVRSPDWGNAARSFGTPSEGIPTAAQQEPPAWFDQLAQYRQELMNEPERENPEKIRAARIMHGTLSGMANMVRSAGFQTRGGDGTGIDDSSMIGREELKR